MDIEKFSTALKQSNMSKNAISSYLYAGRQFAKRYGAANRTNFQAYKAWLLENFALKTVNVRIVALNWYIVHVMKKPNLKIPHIKEQQKPFLENVISESDYEYLKKRLEAENDKKLYFAVRFLAATGARISEFMQFKVEDVRRGHVDIYGKGCKLRRIYIPETLRSSALGWLQDIGKESGFLWTNRYGELMTPRGMFSKLKSAAKKYKMNTEVVYPHSFRHRFAKNFLERYNDICFLADLMGHSSIDTTRIYLRKTATEQREIVDRIITW